jgi:hypothetical protein
MKCSIRFETTSGVRALPRLESEVDSSASFSTDELLYRRVRREEELNEGEIDPTRFNSFSFKKGIEGAPSVLRGKFATATDALHPDCANGTDVSKLLVYGITTGDLPPVISSDCGKKFEVFPLHKPEPLCGAHSVVATCEAGDALRSYAIPTKSARNDLKVKLAAKMRPVAISAENQVSPPNGDSSDRSS